MTYLELKDKLEKAVVDKDTKAVLDLFTIENAIVKRNYDAGLASRKLYYKKLRDQFKLTASDDDFEIIFNSGLSIEEKNKRLVDLGVKITNPKKDNRWRPFN